MLYMENGVLKLAKVTSDTSIDEMRAIFNFNMDQLMVFGGGAQGDPGKPGDIGVQGDQGYSVYGNGDKSLTDDEIIKAVKQEEESQITNTGSDIFVNSAGVFKVSRDDARTVTPLFFWKEETADDYSERSYPFIFDKADEQEATPQNEEIWESTTFTGRLTPKKTYNSSIVLVGDRARWRRAANKSCPTHSPINLLNDGVISFVNMNGDAKYPNTYIYTISASYSESGDDNGRSGLFLGQTVDTDFEFEGVVDVKKSLIHMYMDYIADAQHWSNFTYINGTVVCNGTVTLNKNNALNVIKYKDKWDNDISAQFALVEDTVYFKDTDASFDTGVTLSVLSNNSDRVIMRLEGSINAKYITQAGTSIAFRTTGLVFTLGSRDSELIHGHIINSYGPEHIEFYGSTFASIGLNSLYVKWNSISEPSNMEVILTKSTDSNVCILTDYNNIGVYVNLVFAISLPQIL